MKTPMQELISVIRKRQEDEDVQPFMWLEQIVELAESMLEKEKAVIMDAHIEGQRVFDKFPHTQWTNDQAEQYYNETFNTKEK